MEDLVKSQLQNLIHHHYLFVSVLLAVECEYVFLISSYKQDGAVKSKAQSVQPGHIERAGTVIWRDR